MLIGDVAGHGMGAALLMAMAKVSVQTALDHNSGPAGILEHMNHIIKQVQSRTMRRMISCQVVRFSLDGGTVELANAGHCYPLLVSDAGKKSEFLEVAGVPLGAKRQAAYNSKTFIWAAKDLLILYSDGLIEAQNPNGDQLGYEGFRRIVQACWHPDPESFYSSLMTAFYEFCGTTEKNDDLTVLVIASKPSLTPPTLTGPVSSFLGTPDQECSQS